MDAMRYIELKQKGAVRMMRIGKNHFAIGVRKFDPANGEELEPELERITRDGVEAAMKTFEEGVASCKALLADMDADVEPAAKPDDSAT